MKKDWRRQDLDTLNALLHHPGGEDEVARLLRPYLYHEDYVLRSKAFAFLPWRPLRPLTPVLLGFLNGTEKREWELRALAGLAAGGDPALASPLTPLLGQQSRPLLMRGTLWVLAVVGGETARNAIAGFLCSPCRRYLKDSFLADTLGRLLAKPAEQDGWASLLRENDALAAVFSAYQPLLADRKKEQNDFTNVYPCRDYLLIMARKQGVPDRYFRRAMYYRK